MRRALEVLLILGLVGLFFWSNPSAADGETFASHHSELRIEGTRFALTWWGCGIPSKMQGNVSRPAPDRIVLNLPKSLETYRVVSYGEVRRLMPIGVNHGPEYVQVLPEERRPAPLPQLATRSGGPLRVDRICLGMPQSSVEDLYGPPWKGSAVDGSLYYPTGRGEVQVAYTGGQVQVVDWVSGSALSRDGPTLLDTRSSLADIETVFRTVPRLQGGAYVYPHAKISYDAERQMIESFMLY